MFQSLDNCLHATCFRFGLYGGTDIIVHCYLDSCTAINTGTLFLHQWIITYYPHIIKSYEHYDDDNRSLSIILGCAIHVSKTKKTTLGSSPPSSLTKNGKLIAMEVWCHFLLVPVKSLQLMSS